MSTLYPGLNQEINTCRTPRKSIPESHELTWFSVGCILFARAFNGSGYVAGIVGLIIRIRFCGFIAKKHSKTSRNSVGNCLKEAPNIEALIITFAFGGILYYSVITRNTQNSISKYLGPYIMLLGPCGGFVDAGDWRPPTARSPAQRVPWPVPA